MVHRRLQDAAKAARTVAGWAARYRRFLLLKGSAAKAPKDAQGIALQVSAGATTRPAPKWPAVLNTALQKDESFDPRFNPVIAREALLDWTSVGAFVAGQKRRQFSSATSSPRSTRRRKTPHRSTWPNTRNTGLKVFLRLKVNVTGWDPFFREGSQPQNWKAWEVNASLKEVTRQILDALAQVSDAAKTMGADQKLQAARASLPGVARSV